MEQELQDIKTGLEDLRLVVGNIPIITKESLQYKPPGESQHVLLAEVLDSLHNRLNRLEELIFDSGK
jgi:hypothetical protein